jgi:hypothetical protein
MLKGPVSEGFVGELMLKPGFSHYAPTNGSFSEIDFCDLGECGG